MRAPLRSALASVCALLMAVGLQLVVADDQQHPRRSQNVLSSELQPCGHGAGVSGDGFCRATVNDKDHQLVCVDETPEYVAFLRARHPNEFHSHVRRHGDSPLDGTVRRLCVSAHQWRLAAASGAAPDAILASTHDSVLRHIPHVTLFKINAMHFADDEMKAMAAVKAAESGEAPPVPPPLRHLNVWDLIPSPPPPSAPRPSQADGEL
jgi:uncharacterized protein (DUF2237 family)